jgi:molybdate transport system ATP-binding protein
VSRGLGIELSRIDLDRGGRRVLREVSWRIRPGERWGLLGHNGAGKTQLLKLIAGDVWPKSTRGGRRTYVLGRERHPDPLFAKELIAYVGAERQDKYARYGWNPTVADLIATGVFRTDLLLEKPDARQRAQVARLIRRFGLEALARRRFLTLSYGERRLALIARAMAAKPSLLLLDEVFNGLDRERRSTLMHFLQSFKRSRMPWVLAAHRVQDLPESLTHVLILDRGRVRHAGRPSRALFERVFRVPTVARARRRSKLPTPHGHNDSPLIRIRNADVYADGQRVLQQISWEIRRGEHWAILGRNGAGKSSLIKLVYGDLAPAAGGALERSGFPRGSHIEDFKKTVGFLSPELQSDYSRDDVSVEDIVISGRHASIGLNEVPSRADRRAAQRWLRTFELEKFAALKPRELSYGQLRRVLLARAMVNSPRLLLLDEPCAGLDATTRSEVLTQVERLTHTGVQVVMATHHEADLVPAINRVLHLRQGKVVAA